MNEFTSINWILRHSGRYEIISKQRVIPMGLLDMLADKPSGQWYLTKIIFYVMILSDNIFWNAL